jgi:hypothetical protein
VSAQFSPSCQIPLKLGSSRSAPQDEGGEQPRPVPTAADQISSPPVQTYGGLDCAVNNAGTEATGLIAIFDVLIARRRVRTLCDCPDERRPSMKGLRLGRKKPEPAETTKPSRLSRKKPEPAETTKPSRLSRKKPESNGG